MGLGTSLSWGGVEFYSDFKEEKDPSNCQMWHQG
jgi:hypothetical protein